MKKEGNIIKKGRVVSCGYSEDGLGFGRILSIRLKKAKTTKEKLKCTKNILTFINSYKIAKRFCLKTENYEYFIFLESDKNWLTLKPILKTDNDNIVKMFSIFLQLYRFKNIRTAMHEEELGEEYDEFFLQFKK